MEQEIYGSFRKYAHFGFFIPEKRDQYGWDFFVNNKNDLWALDWQRVMARPLKNAKWKKPEAKIIKLLWKDTIKQEAHKIKTIEWIYVKNGSEFWFIEVENKDTWYFVHDSKRAGAQNGDLVEATLSQYNGRTEAKVTRVVVDEVLIYWEYTSKWDFWFVYTKKWDDDIFIWSNYANGAVSWDTVGVKIIKKTWKKPEWIIVEIKKDES